MSGMIDLFFGSRLFKAAQVEPPETLPKGVPQTPGALTLFFGGQRPHLLKRLARGRKELAQWRGVAVTRPGGRQTRARRTNGQRKRRRHERGCGGSCTLQGSTPQPQWQAKQGGTSGSAAAPGRCAPSGAGPRAGRPRQHGQRVCRWCRLLPERHSKGGARWRQAQGAGHRGSTGRFRAPASRQTRAAVCSRGQPRLRNNPARAHAARWSPKGSRRRRHRQSRLEMGRGSIPCPRLTQVHADIRAFP